MDSERRSESFLGPQSRLPESRSTLAFVECRVDTVSNDDSPINAVRTTRKLSTAIGVVRVYFVTICMIGTIRTN